MKPGQPPVYGEHFELIVAGRRMAGTRLVHDGPCVFVDDECSCGVLDLGIIPRLQDRPPARYCGSGDLDGRCAACGAHTGEQVEFCAACQLELSHTEDDL